MEALLVLGGLIALAGLAPWLGKDSRERSISDEERLAKLGFNWGAAAPRSGRETSWGGHRVLRIERTGTVVDLR